MSSTLLPQQRNFSPLDTTLRSSAYLEQSSALTAAEGAIANALRHQSRSGDSPAAPASNGRLQQIAARVLGQRSTLTSTQPTTASNRGSATLTNAANDFVGDALTSAYNLGNLSGSSFYWNDAVSASDTHDFFRFSLSNANSLTLRLSGMSADADIRLLDRWGNLVAQSSNYGSANETISRFLAAGTYYVQVSSYESASTRYALNVSGTGTVTDPGSTFASAHDLGNLSRSYRTRIDSVSRIDANDYYRFELTETGRFSLNLSGMSADADVRLFNSGGVQIGQSTRPWAQAEAINGQLAAGVYYVRVYAYNGSSTQYNLRLESTTAPNPTPSPVPPAFSSTYGYGLVNAAAAVARAIGQANFANVVDLGGNNWGNDLVNAPEAWARGYTGRGITVAVIDDGVDITHSELRNNIWRNSREIAGNGIDDDGNGYVDDLNGWNFTTGATGNNGNVRPESRFSNHGTHVAGTIAAANDGVGMTGVAHNAQIMALKIANTNSNDQWVNTGNIARAIRYAVDNGARVINMSLRWSDSAELRDALAYAASRNVITVSAAGNEAAAIPGTPARYATQYGISVGAVDRQFRIANFSNKPGSDSRMQHVMAPGVGIFSTAPGNGYATMNGTSMASPHVAGVVALMLSANPNLTHAQVRQILTSSATQLS